MVICGSGIEALWGKAGTRLGAGRYEAAHLGGWRSERIWRVTRILWGIQLVLRLLFSGFPQLFQAWTCSGDMHSRIAAGR